jgi:Cu-Zn family superoxide dismutase
MIRSSLVMVACGLVAGGCISNDEGWQTGRPDIPGAQPVVVASPSWEHEGISLQRGHRHDSGPQVEAKRAVAVIVPTEGNQAKGTVQFEDRPEGLHIVADLRKLPPSSSLGFHIHEFGDVSAADAMSAGGHYNPGGHPHAGPHDGERHAGDLGNVQTDASGNARVELTVRDLSVAGKNAVLGRAVVVHAQADDLKSQPAGNAGARIGVGIIGVAKQ